MEKPLKKVLVIGGAGFIGSHVVKNLMAQGVPVKIFDSFSSGSRENIPDSVEVIEGDIRNRDVLMKAMEEISHIVHLAAIVSVPESMRDPITTHEVNTSGFTNVLESARLSGIDRVVYASSAAVYGNNPVLPKVETMSVEPLSPYALSKYENELAAGLYEKIYGLSPIGLRFFNVYGPGQRGDHPYASVIPRFIEALQEGKPIKIYGDGTQTRDFVHVSDVARAITKALTVNSDSAHVINIASGTKISLLELLESIEDIKGVPVVRDIQDQRAGDILHSVADITKAKDVLGFTPEKKFSEGIKELL